jgi:hypothetical protein
MKIKVINTIPSQEEREKTEKELGKEYIVLYAEHLNQEDREATAVEVAMYKIIKGLDK